MRQQPRNEGDKNVKLQSLHTPIKERPTLDVSFLKSAASMQSPMTDQAMVFESRLDFERAKKAPHSTRSNTSHLDPLPSPSEKTFNFLSTSLDQGSMPLLIATDEERRTYFQHLKTRGFTPEMRREVWLLCSGARMAMYNSITQGVMLPSADESLSMANECTGQDYLSLVTLYNRKYPTCNKHQIAVDMPRTFQDDSFFRYIGVVKKPVKRSSKRHRTQSTQMSTASAATGRDVKDAIKRICTAYSVRNNQLGYCQGFNFIVGRLLQVMTEEEAFWTFTSIIECMMPIDYYANMQGALVDQRIVEELLARELPALHAHFEANFFKVEMSCLQWFTCLFSYNFNLDVVIRLWDLIFLKGQKMLFRISLAIFHLMQNEFFECENLQQIMKKLESIPNLLYDYSLLIQVTKMP